MVYLSILSIFLQKEEKKRQVKTAMKLYPFIYDHYPRQIDGVPWPDGNLFSILYKTDCNRLYLLAR